MKRTLLPSLAAVGLMLGASFSVPSQPAKAASLFSTLVWSDEFNTGKTVDTNKWNVVTGGGGWGNGELETYTSSRNNVKVGSGYLDLQALNSTSGITSGKITTQNKKSWMYGRLDVRAKLPTGVGSWPAIWLMPQGAKYGTDYLANGEIDMMEEVGADQNQIVGSAHSLLYNPANGNTRHGMITIPNANTAFHVYSLEWTPSYLSYQIDGQEFYRVNNDYTGYTSWPYDQQFYLILNQAVGGSWGGYKGVNTASMPWHYQIDYVRLYQ